MKILSVTLFLIFLICIWSSNTLAQSITKENIENAEQISGLDFSDTERDSMVESLNDQLNNYKKIRELDLKNSIPPAILFNPIPVGFKFPKEQRQVQFSDYSYVKMPSDKNNFHFIQ